MELSSLAEAGFDASGVALGCAHGPVEASAAGARPIVLSAARIVDVARWPFLARRLSTREGGLPEVVHLTDLRLAPLGRRLRRRLGVAVSADVAPRDLVARGSRLEALFDALDELDAAFVFGSAGEAELRRRTRRVAITPLPLVALEPPEPSAALVSKLQRALKRAPSGQPVVAIPWTVDLSQWRMFRRDIAPSLGADVTLLAIGVPDRGARSELRALLGAGSMPAVYVGRLDDATVAAIARLADAFLVPWRLGARAPEADALMRLALAASGVPVVASDAGAPLEHERNAFLVRDGDGAGIRATLDRLFALPARQRHYVGAEFAADVLARYPAAAAVRLYDERFASLAGRPRIPRELRAA